jgi:hypothetical protein
MPSARDDASHWRSLASEARAVADGMADPASRLIMLKIAEGYERLAARADARSKNIR